MLILPDYASPSGAASRRVKESVVQRSSLRWAGRTLGAPARYERIPRGATGPRR